MDLLTTAYVSLMSVSCDCLYHKERGRRDKVTCIHLYFTLCQLLQKLRFNIKVRTGSGPGFCVYVWGPAGLKPFSWTSPASRGFLCPLHPPTATTCSPHLPEVSTVISVPKKGTVSCLSDYRPVALTHIITKCFTSDLHPC